MRLQIFSDFHFDVTRAQAPRVVPGVDAVIVAGDVCEGIPRGFQWLRDHLGPDVPIVFVAGNHEYFGRSLAAEQAAGAAAARKLGITFLEGQEARFGRVRFIGATLWADFDLFGEEARADAMKAAEAFMVDHRQIARTDGRAFLATDARAAHIAARQILVERLAEPHDGPTVVVTHHAPHKQSLADKFRDDPLSAAFISDLSGLIEAHRPALWVHGHTHVSFDYRVGPTRIVCNPHGYGDENAAFDPALVVAI
jgi:predicted phosphodiesterase